MKFPGKLLALSLPALATFAALPAWSVGNPAAGQTKAIVCMLCHGSKDFPGTFYTCNWRGGTPTS